MKSNPPLITPFAGPHDVNKRANLVLSCGVSTGSWDEDRDGEVVGTGVVVLLLGIEILSKVGKGPAAPSRVKREGDHSEEHVMLTFFQQRFLHRNTLLSIPNQPYSNRNTFTSEKSIILLVCDGPYFAKNGRW